MPTAIGRGVGMAQTPLQTAYVMAHARSAGQLLFRVCVHSQN